MTAQPVHSSGPEEPRVPRTVDGIAAALSPAKRMDFYRQLGTARLEQAEAVLRRWWCEAMLDTDPEAEQVRIEAEQGINCFPAEDVFPEFAELVARARAERHE
ncbi:hypothetical protein AB0K60_15685 [Thermopolyspora sp. NPDC052614]|uniref:hypothetical protein n=1 Tax=Thermopolyspora sp. NPDC052614 TaxID=3155682 RepID=UPI0034442F14